MRGNQCQVIHIELAVALICELLQERHGRLLEVVR